MDTLQSMRVFREIVDAGSFVGAAKKLDISTAMASKHLMHLERRLGARLLNRSSRHLSLTDAGSAYYEQTREMLDTLEQAEAAVSHASVVPRGTLRVTAPVWFATRHFTRLIAGYRARYPDVLLDIDLNDRIVDLVEEGYDLGLRVTPAPGATLIARRLAEIEFVIVAAPSYVAARGEPRAPAEVATHAWIGYAYALSSEFTVTGPDGTETVSAPSTLRTNSTALALQMATAGMGIAILPPWMTEDEIAAGRLVEILPGYALAPIPLYAVYTSRRYLSPKVRTFVDFMAGECRDDGRPCIEPAMPAQVAKTTRSARSRRLVDMRKR
jgi:DNA-binding transcriptional LysR family regulator